MHSYFLYACHRFFHSCLTSFTTVLKCLNLFNEMTDIFLILLQSFRLEIDRYIGWPIFFPIFKHFTIIGYRFCKKKISFFFFFFFFFVTYIIIQSITSSAILFSAFDPSKCTHTWSSVHSGEAPAQPPHVTLYKINLFETRWIILTFTIEPLFRQ